MNPSSHAVSVLRWEPRLPGDKSITHRAFLLGGMAAGVSEVRGANPGADCTATLRAVERLGAGIEKTEDVIRIRGAETWAAPSSALDLGNSGTGLRLLMGAVAGRNLEVELTGDASLRTRPVERVLAPLRKMGAESRTDGDHPPVVLRGGSLRGIDIALPVPSAQVKSALLLAGIQAQGVTRVSGVAGTRDHTERLLPAFGAPVTVEPDAVSVTGPQRLRASPVTVPGDPSAAAFYCTAAAIIPGSEVHLRGVSLNPTRVRYLDVIRDLGVGVDVDPRGESEAEPWGDVRLRAGDLRAFSIESELVPWIVDELPALAVAAAFAEGTTEIRGAGELRVKESDRLEAVAEGLTAIGARVRLLTDGWIIEGSGGAPLPGGTVRSRGDHRIAMAFLIGGLRCRQGVVIEDTPHIETSDPFFLFNLKAALS